jgi:hypothetical protein
MFSGKEDDMAEHPNSSGGAFGSSMTQSESVLGRDRGIDERAVGLI